MDRVWQRKSVNFILVHDVVLHLGQLTSIRPTFFHALCRCDTTSSISGKGKIEFREFMEVNLTKQLYSTYRKTEEDYKLIEKLFIILYSKEKQI